jgi:hypothetical protein
VTRVITEEIDSAGRDTGSSMTHTEFQDQLIATRPRKSSTRARRSLASAGVMSHQAGENPIMCMAPNQLTDS